MGTDDVVTLDGRKLRTVRSRAAMSRAAFALLTERGLEAVAVEDIAVRAGVTRRTFSRHFSSIEEAVLGDIDQDVHAFNAALAERPPGEPPLIAYRNAVHDWLGAVFGEGREAELAHRWELFQHFEDEPALLAAYQRIRVAAEGESRRILADRLGVDPAADLRPAAAVAAGAALIVAALQAWASGDDPGTLPALMTEFFDTLGSLAAQAVNASILDEEA
ncbi:TetR/AcrR family transcriptional regulator [Nocardia sp. NPDC052566]|uniref:TetR/AcrR family transcriptional regulator n=1 Tax=Nocardia sp. NPDC052566 TaxID=3364330 RepID=UPI0037C7006A